MGSDLPFGLAVKCFRSGVHSGNIFAMWSFTRNIPSTNPLSSPLCTHIPVLGTGCCGSYNPTTKNGQKVSHSLRSILLGLPFTLDKVLAGSRLLDADPNNFRGCASASDRWRTGGSTGTSDFAKYDEKGQLASSVKFPFCLVLVPNPVVRDAISGACERVGALDAFEECKTGDKVWTVYCLASPDPKSAFEAGTIVLESPFVKSEFSDTRLHFSHTLYSDDVQCGDDCMGWDKEFTPTRAALESPELFAEFTR